MAQTYAPQGPLDQATLSQIRAGGFMQPGDDEERRRQLMARAQGAQPHNSGLKQLLVNGGALAASTGIGLLADAATPFTFGGSLAVGGIAGAGIEALRAKMLGEQNSWKNDLIAGGLTVMPGGIFGKGLKAGKTGITALKDGASLTRGALKTATDGSFLSRPVGSLIPKVTSAADRTAQIVPDIVKPTTKADSLIAPTVRPQVPTADPLTAQPLAHADPIAATAQPSDFANFHNVMPADQLAAKVHANTLQNGGGTFNLAGESPSNGYAFTHPGTDFSVSTNKLNAKHVTDFIKNNQDALAQPGNHIGSHVENGKTTLSVTHVGNPTPETLAAAQRARQVTAFDLGNNAEIPLGKINGRGYNKLDEASNIHSQHQGQVAGTGGTTGDASAHELPFGQEPGGTPAQQQPIPADQGSAASQVQSVPTASNNPQVDKPGFSFSDVFKNAFTPRDSNFGLTGTVGEKIANKGTSMRASARGVTAGMRPEGAGAKLRPGQADDINSYLDATTKGDTYHQLEQVGRAKQAAAENLQNTLDTHNVPLQAGDAQALHEQALGNIQGVNGKGVPGYNADLHSPITDSYSHLLSSATDLKGLNNFKQGLDKDVINYGRSAAAADPIREQLAQQYRDVVAGKISELNPSGEIHAANEAYGQAANAEKALVQSKNLDPKGIKVGTGVVDLGGKGIGASKIQGGRDFVGRKLQGVGDFFTTPAGQKLAQQYLLHGPVTTSLSGQGIVDKSDPSTALFNSLSPGDQNLLQTAPPTDPFADPNAPSGPSADDINSALNNGFDQNGNVIPDGSLQKSGVDNTDSSASPYSSSELFQAAIKAFQNGDAKSSDQFLQLASFAAAQEKAAAASGTGGKGKGGIGVAQQKDIASVKNASGLLQAIEQQFAGAGGGKGLSGYATHIPVIGQYLNTNMAAYNQTKIDAAVAYAQALAGSGRQPAEAVIKQVAEALPSATDTPAQARQKLANLRMHLTHREQTVLNYPDNSSDLPASQSAIDQNLISNGYGNGASTTDLYTSLGL